ncbi:hypothetical protein Gogos_004704 [Gossypium gossypioides]|uniref:RNase H type-1 domain-containing protein n=1 Tax=Gossypium gossypioides TaxID=34282 RepID=A0A7J9CH35_GOSGO|nr:hypothetical protein [Gossypium gossypioides]
MQWKKIIIEGDSLSIIKKCKAKNPDKSLSKKEIYLIGSAPESVEKQEERDRVREPD